MRRTGISSLYRSVIYLMGCLSIIGLGIAGAGCVLGTDSEPPSAPTGLTASTESGTIVLIWKEVRESDVLGYNVYRDTSSIDGLSELDPLTGERLTPDTTYEDTPEEERTTYHYVVTAVDRDGNESDPSGTVKQTLFGEPPNPR